MTDTDSRTVTREELATALEGSGLIRRYDEYSRDAHPETMRETPRDELARTWADAIFAAFPSGMSREEPAMLDVDTFLAGLDSPNHSPESRRAWVSLFYRDLSQAALAVPGDALRTALATARNDLLAYGFHLDGEWVNKRGNPASHRRPGEPCNCGLDAAIARASAALGNAPQSERERAALGQATP